MIFNSVIILGDPELYRRDGEVLHWARIRHGGGQRKLYVSPTLILEAGHANLMCHRPNLDCNAITN